MYCYEKPRTEDKTHTRKSFSLSAKTTPSAALHQSLPGVVQRMFVGRDSEELTDSLRSKTRSLSGYGIDDRRIHYSLSESAHRDLSGTVQLCAKPVAGQQPGGLSDTQKKTVFDKLNKAIDWIPDDCKKDPVQLGKIIIGYISEAKYTSWTWEDVKAIAAKTSKWNVEQETGLEGEPPKPESKSLGGYEVLFDVGSYECAKEYKDLVIAQPFESGFTAEHDKKKYYHTKGRREYKPIWQITAMSKGGEEKSVTVKILGLYQHTGTTNKKYKLYAGCDKAPKKLTIES